MTKTIAIGWHELPYYASRCIAKAIELVDLPIVVLSTGTEAEAVRRNARAGFPVQWIDSERRVRWPELELDPPACLFVVGWSVPALHGLARETKKNGGKVVCLVDNIPRHDLRQTLGSLYFRLTYRRLYDAAFVPGRLAKRLMRQFGMPSDSIYEGSYGADPTVFYPPPAGRDRRREFLFVGQFIQRKGIEPLLRAFSRFRTRHPSWVLRMVGAGPLRESIRGEGVVREDFLPPDDLASRYRSAKVFVLPSLDEHWGVVAHEAALSGMPLVLSDTIGAAADLLDESNGLSFRAGSVSSLEQALEQAGSLSEAEYAAMSSSSVQKARRFGPDRWADAFAAILSRLLPAQEDGTPAPRTR